MKRWKMVTTIGLICGAVVLATEPAEAFAPPVYIVPAVASTLTVEAGVVASLVSGVGELAIAGYGAYLGWTTISHFFRVKVPYHSGSGSDPMTNPTTSIWSGGDYYNTYPGQVTGGWDQLSYSSIWRSVNVVNWSNYSFTLFGGSAYVGQIPNLTTGANPSTWTSHSSTESLIGCSITVKTVATGIYKFVYDTANGTDSLLSPVSTPNQASFTIPKCATQIQNEITSAGVDNSTVMLVSENIGSAGASFATSPNYGFASHVLTGLTAQTMQGTTTCKNAGGSILTIAGSVLNLTSGVADVELKGCPAGYYVYDSKIVQGDGVTTHTAYDLGQKASTSSSYPLCAGVNQCQLQVYYKTVPCTDSVGACTDWYKDYIVSPTDFQCYWGTYLLTGMTDCAPLIYQYDPNAVRNSDGIAVKSNIVSPPSNDLTQSATSTHTDNGFSGCAPSGWNVLNPVAYVGMQGCLLQWLFIPSTSEFEGAITNVQTTWSGSAVGSFINAVIAVPASFGTFAGNGMTGCEVSVTLPFNTSTSGAVPDQTIKLLPACSGNVQTIANLCHLVLTITCIFVGTFAVSRPITRALGLPDIGRGVGDA